jgi:hypothetical protein
MYGVPPRHKSGPAGGAGGLHVVTVKDDAVVSQSVDVWRRDLIRTMETNVIPTLYSEHV